MTRVAKPFSDRQTVRRSPSSSVIAKQLGVRRATHLSPRVATTSTAAPTCNAMHVTSTAA
jgi:hypothetical protein